MFNTVFNDYVTIIIIIYASENIYISLKIENWNHIPSAYIFFVVIYFVEAEAQTSIVTMHSIIVWAIRETGSFITGLIGCCLYNQVVDFLVYCNWQLVIRAIRDSPSTTSFCNIFLWTFIVLINTRQTCFTFLEMLLCYWPNILLY